MQPASDMFEDAPTDAELAGIDAPDDRWPSLLAELMDVLAASFRRRGAEPERALIDAQHAALAIGEYMGGIRLYLPTGERLKTAIRDRRMYLEYNGRNKEMMAQRYSLTERRVEQIAAEQRAIHVRKLQGRLFDE